MQKSGIYSGGKKRDRSPTGEGTREALALGCTLLGVCRARGSVLLVQVLLTRSWTASVLLANRSLSSPEFGSALTRVFLLCIGPGGRGQ